MAHDYGKDKNRKKPAKKNQRVSSPAIKVPGWLLFGSGVAFTLFAQFLYHVATVQPETAGTGTEVAATAAPAPKKPTINFYNQLKEAEVEVPQEETPPAAFEPVTGENKQAEPVSESKPAETVAAAKPVYNQVLQAGSYKSQVDADEQRAALTLLGVKAGIVSKTNPDGITYYRVMVGPFSSATELEKARQTLNSNNIPTITVKR